MSKRYNNGSHYENHQRAAELHDGAAHAHRSAAEAHEKQDHQTGQELSRQALEHSERAYQHTAQTHEEPVNEHGMAIFGHGEISELAYSLWQGRGRRKDRRMRTGSMRRSNCAYAELASGSQQKLKGSEKMKHPYLSSFPVRAVVCAALLFVAEGGRLPAQQPPQTPPPSQALASNQLDDLVAQSRSTPIRY